MWERNRFESFFRESRRPQSLAETRRLDLVIHSIVSCIPFGKLGDMKKVVFVLLAGLCLSLELRAADSADTGEKKKSKGFSGFFDSLLNSGKPTTSSSSQGTNEVALTGISS